VKKAVTVVGAMFGMLEASDLIDTNPVSKAKARWPGLLKPPTDQVRNVEVKEPLSMASLMHLSASAAEPFSTALMLMAHTGIRVGELLALEPKHVDLLRSTLTVEQALSRVGRMDDRTLLAGMRLSSTKSGKTRQVPLNREACARLSTYLGTRRADDRFLFGAGSLPLDYWRLRGAFDKASASTGLSGYGLHDIRKAFATALIADGLDVKSVGALLGHSPSSVQAVTMTIYAQPSTSRAAAAVESLTQAMNQ
jgi:integrase